MSRTTALPPTATSPSPTSPSAIATPTRTATFTGAPCSRSPPSGASWATASASGGRPSAERTPAFSAAVRACAASSRLRMVACISSAPASMKANGPWPSSAASTAVCHASNAAATAWSCSGVSGALATMDSTRRMAPPSSMPNEPLPLARTNASHADAPRGWGMPWKASRRMPAPNRVARRRAAWTGSRDCWNAAAIARKCASKPLEKPDGSSSPPCSWACSIC
ncbi:MAG: hypothetical protein RLZZ217_628 [Planctomycetota bacterium]